MTVPGESVERWTDIVAAWKVKYHTRRRSVLSERRRVLDVASLDHTWSLPPPRPRCPPLHQQRRGDLSWTSRPPSISCPPPVSHAARLLHPRLFYDLQMTLKHLIVSPSQAPSPRLTLVRCFCDDVHRNASTKLSTTLIDIQMTLQ